MVWNLCKNFLCIAWHQKSCPRSYWMAPKLLALLAHIDILWWAHRPRWVLGSAAPVPPAAPSNPKTNISPNAMQPTQLENAVLSSQYCCRISWIGFFSVFKKTLFLEYSQYSLRVCWLDYKKNMVLPENSKKQTLGQENIFKWLIVNRPDCKSRLSFEFQYKLRNQSFNAPFHLLNFFTKLLLKPKCHFNVKINKLAFLE